MRLRRDHFALPLGHNLPFEKASIAVKTLGRGKLSTSVVDDARGLPTSGKVHIWYLQTVHMYNRNELTYL